MTKAEQMHERWVNDPETIESPESLAKAIDTRVRVEGFLNTARQRFIFSDGSVALFANGCLKVNAMNDLVGRIISNNS